MKTNLIEEAIDIIAGPGYGRQAEVARVLGISRASLFAMKESGRASFKQCMKIEAATGGKITAVMLRPDIFGTPEV